MKKIVSIIITYLLLCGCTACSQKETSLEKEQFLLTESLHLTNGMDELADSKEYLSLMAPSETINQIAAEIGSQDYQSPQTVYLLELPDNILKQLTSVFGDGSDILEGMSDSVLEKASSKINGSTLSNIINASSGSEVLAATSFLTWGESYLQPGDWSNNTLVLLMYDGNYSSMVSFVQSGDGIISASANFIKNNDIMEELKSSEDEAVLWEQLFGITGIEYTKYTSEELEKLISEKE